MKKLLFICLFISAPFFLLAESEPNENPAQADELTLNVADGGTFTTGAYPEDDWWKITVSVDDSIVITTSSADIYPWFNFYGPDGVTSPAAVYSSTVDKTTTCSYGLSPGTYYIHVGRFYWGIGSYTIVANSFPATLTNDVEPNKYAEIATNLPVDDTLTGHIGFWKEGQLDTTDWYKITTPADGKLVIKTTQHSPYWLLSDLYDQDTTTVIASNSGCPQSDTTKTITYNKLAAGTYYIKNYMQYWSKHGFASYTISNEFIPVGLTNDTEPNNSAVTAINFSVNGTLTGHIGYYGNTITDAEDWYKITIPADGKLVVNTSSDSTLCFIAYLYDQDTTTQIATTNSFECDIFNKTMTYNNLTPGTYFIKCIRWNDPATDHGAYTISNLFTPAGLTNDTEPNNSAVTAVNFSVNGTLTGHIGYYGNTITDVEDWYKITIPADGKLVVNTSSDSTLCFIAYLYDQDTTTQIATTNSFECDIFNKTMTYNNLTPGTYFIKCIRWNDPATDHGAYTISNVFTPADLTNDTEPNNYALNAITLPVNDTLTGHIGYYGNTITDATDWYKITIPADGKLAVNSIYDSTVCLITYLYDQDSVTQLTDTWTACDVYNKTMTYNNLMPGTYYIKCVRNGGFITTYGAYTISNVFTPADLTNDTEPNKYALNAINLPVNDTLTGHIGYYGNTITDVTDWYKITIPADGKLAVNSIYDSTVCLITYLYDQDSVTQLTDTWTACDVYNKTMTYNNLMPGTYYIKCVRNGGFITAYGAYTISNVFTPADLTNDTEPNNYALNAINLPVNDTLTGHLGYYSNNTTDATDWYEITIPADGKLTINTSSDTTLCLLTYLYDQDSATQLIDTWALFDCDTFNKSMTYNNLASGTYFIKCIRHTGYAIKHGAYSISNLFTPAGLTNDAEPNNYALNAITLPVNDTLTGHIGYYGNTITDATDWYKIIISAGGDIVINTSSDTTVCLIAYLYDQDSVLELASTWSFNCDVYNKNMNYSNLTPGTYFIKCIRYLIHPATYGSYTISNEFTIVTDIEKNNMQENKFIVYPNPSNGEINLSSGQLLNNANIRLMNVQGEIILEKTNFNGKSFNFDISEQANGLYFLEITENNSVSRIKVVKY